MSPAEVIPRLRESRIVRYTLDERIHHWLAGLSYLYCMVTGLAFWSPYLYWLAALVGGGAVARFWHPWAGVLFYNFGFVDVEALAKRRRLLRDVDRAWSKAMKYYGERRRKAAGRPVHYGQKLFFWLMLYGAIPAAFGTGISGSSKRSPAWLRHLSTAVHVIAALATIAYHHSRTWEPRWSAAASMRSSRAVTSSRARHHHRRYEKVTRGK